MAAHSLVGTNNTLIFSNSLLAVVAAHNLVGTNNSQKPRVEDPNVVVVHSLVGTNNVILFVRFQARFWLLSVWRVKTTFGFVNFKGFHPYPSFATRGFWF